MHLPSLVIGNPCSLTRDTARAPTSNVAADFDFNTKRPTVPVLDPRGRKRLIRVSLMTDEIKAAHS